MKIFYNKHCRGHISRYCPFILKVWLLRCSFQNPRSMHTKLYLESLAFWITVGWLLKKTNSILRKTALSIIIIDKTKKKYIKIKISHSKYLATYWARKKLHLNLQHKQLVFYCCAGTATG